MRLILFSNTTDISIARRLDGYDKCTTLNINILYSMAESPTRLFYYTNFTFKTYLLTYFINNSNHGANIMHAHVYMSPHRRSDIRDGTCTTFWPSFQCFTRSRVGSSLPQGSRCCGVCHLAIS